MHDRQKMSMMMYYDFANPHITQDSIVLKVTKEGTVANELMTDVATVLGVAKNKVPSIVDMHIQKNVIAKKTSARSTFRQEVIAYTASLIHGIHDLTLEILRIHVEYERGYLNKATAGANNTASRASELFRLVKLPPDVKRATRANVQTAAGETAASKKHNLTALRMKLRGLNMAALKRMHMKNPADPVAALLNQRNQVAFKEFDSLTMRYERALDTIDEFERLTRSIDDAFEFIHPGVRVNGMTDPIPTEQKWRMITTALEVYRAEMAEITQALPTKLQKKAVEETVRVVAHGSGTAPSTPHTTGGKVGTKVANEQTVQRLTTTMATVQEDLAVGSVARAKSDALIAEYETTISNLRAGQAHMNQRLANVTNGARTELDALEKRLRRLQRKESGARYTIQMQHAEMTAYAKEIRQLKALVTTLRTDAGNDTLRFKAKLKRVTRSYTDQIKAVKAQLEKRKKRLRSMNRAAKTTNAQMVSYQRDIRALTLVAKQMGKQMRESTIRYKARISRLANESTTRVEAVKRRVQRVQRLLRQTQSALGTSQVAGRVKDGMITRYIQHIETLKRRLSKKQRVLNSTTENLGDIETSVRSLVKQLKQARAENRQLTAKVASDTAKVRRIRRTLASMTLASALVSSVPYFMKYDTRAVNVLVARSAVDQRQILPPPTTPPRLVGRLEARPRIAAKTNTAMVTVPSPSIGFTPYDLDETNSSHLLLLGFVAALALGVGTRLLKRIRYTPSHDEVWDESFPLQYAYQNNEARGRYTPDKEPPNQRKRPQLSRTSSMTTANLSYVSEDGRGWGKGHGRYGLRPKRG